MKMIDVSMTARDHWRWKVTHDITSDFGEDSDFRSSRVQLSAHAFTHVDTPLHCKPGENTMEEMAADAYSGEAVVVDLSSKKADEAITVEDLQNAGIKDHEKIIILKTCWDKTYGYETREFWSKAPYVTMEAAQWLLEKKPEAVAFDFPQDYPLKLIDSKNPFQVKDMPTHELLLKNGILLIEYLCNLSQVTKERVQFICLPLKLEGFEGAPARAVVIE
ncbi:cyclase family protein [Halalkalibacter oceani]|uniref:cyclase family protein n=1 Tax=Halalkalibacter oceani TaxID=1653776 RepID=UPI003393043E